jgi:hypothetical protein
MIPAVMFYCSDASAVLVVEVLTCVCWSSSLVVQVRALFWCRDLLWSWPSGHHAPSYVHLHSVSFISCKGVLDRSFKANASLISPWVPLVRSPYADGFYSRYITHIHATHSEENPFSLRSANTRGLAQQVVAEILNE